MIAELEAKALELRRNIVKMSYVSGTGNITTTSLDRGHCGYARVTEFNCSFSRKSVGSSTVYSLRSSALTSPWFVVAL